MPTQSIKDLGQLISETCCALRQLWWDLPDSYDRALVTTSVRTLHDYLTTLAIDEEEAPHSSSNQLTEPFTHNLALLERLQTAYTAAMAQNLPPTVQAQLQAQESEVTDISAALGNLLNAYLYAVDLETQALPSGQQATSSWLLAS